MLGDAAVHIRQRAAALLRYVMRSAAHVHLWHQVLFASVCKSVVWVGRPPCGWVDGCASAYTCMYSPSLSPYHVTMSPPFHLSLALSFVLSSSLSLSLFSSLALSLSLCCTGMSVVCEGECARDGVGARECARDGVGAR